MDDAGSSNRARVIRIVRTRRNPCASFWKTASPCVVGLPLFIMARGRTLVTEEFLTFLSGAVRLVPR